MFQQSGKSKFRENQEIGDPGDPGIRQSCVFRISFLTPSFGHRKIRQFELEFLRPDLKQRLNGQVEKSRYPLHKNGVSWSRKNRQSFFRKFYFRLIEHRYVFMLTQTLTIVLPENILERPKINVLNGKNSKKLVSHRIRSHVFGLQ